MTFDITRTGRAIRIRRQDLRITQKDLAQRLGMSQAWLSNVERGTITLRREQLSQIAEILGLSGENLLWDVLEGDEVLAALRNQPLLEGEARDALMVLYRRSLQPSPA